MDSAQIKRIAEQCGIQLNTKSPLENDYLATLDELERFAQAIRNQALDEAAACAEGLTAGLSPGVITDIVVPVSTFTAQTIRAMKGE